jgi:hypothetical protein
MRKSIRTAVTAAAIAILNSACLEQGVLNGAVGPIGGSATYASTLDEEDTETCLSNDYNANPRTKGDDPGQFHVCGDDNDSYAMHIDGELKTRLGSSYVGDGLATRICVFPAQVYDYGGSTGKLAVFKADEAGFPMYSCFNIEADESTGEFETVKIRFNLTNFDSAFVIDSKYFNSMRSCLLAGRDEICPDYAFGQFRTLESSDLTRSESN